MEIKPALRQAMDAWAAANAPVQAARAGCEYDYAKHIVRVPFFNRRLSVHSTEVRVEQEGTSAPPPPGVQLVALHYLLNADGSTPADTWATYRHMPDAFLFEPRFNAMAVKPLEQAFGRDQEGFNRAAASLGGTPMTRIGDSAYRFTAFPQIPMGCVLYLADEEMSASVSILFDAVAPSYLCSEDLAFMGIYFSESLINARP